MEAAPLAKRRIRVNYSDGYNEDIIKVLEQDFPEARSEVKLFHKNFEGNTLEDTSHNVWKYLKKHIDYKADGWSQDIRLPARLIEDGTGDCKSYALLAAAIMSYYAPVGFRYASYDRWNKTPSHVYCIVKQPGSHRPIIIDGVWDYFNSEKHRPIKSTII